MIRRLFFSALLLGVFCISHSASAYIPSRQYGAFELKFGPYRPAIDENASISGSPYREVFNDDTMFLTSLELDWQFIHPPGFSLGLGGGIGFMQEYAKAFIEEDGEASETRSNSDYTVLNVMPFNLLFVVRIDALPEYLNVPLAPYFKIGLNWYLWWVLGGNGEVDISEDGERARGGTLGWQVSPGLAIQLDGLDRSTARTFDNEVGVNHSYLFVEILWAFVDRFGNDDYMNLSTNTFANATVLAGLALEF
jgi:hypothetical protein